MEERNRAVALWLLVAVAAAYALLTVVVYYTTGSYGPVWFAGSLLAYGALLVAALWFALVDTWRAAPGAAGPRSESAAKPAQEPQELPRQVIYEADGGRVLLLGGNGGGDGAEYYVEAGAERLPLRDIEARLDRLEAEAPGEDVEAEVESALRRRGEARATGLATEATA